MATIDRITLQPGQSVETMGGYIARSYADGPSYYAETEERLSPSFATYGEALSWLTTAEQLVNSDATPPDGDFYVTVRDAGRTGFLLGPYSDVRDALANVDRGRELAQAANSRAVFYAFGTSRLPIGTKVSTVFGS